MFFITFFQGAETVTFCCTMEEQDLFLLRTAGNHFYFKDRKPVTKMEEFLASQIALAELLWDHTRSMLRLPQHLEHVQRHPRAGLF